MTTIGDTFISGQKTIPYSRRALVDDEKSKIQMKIKNLMLPIKFFSNSI